MKKQKKPDRPSGEFNHNPFKALKGFKPADASRDKAKVPARKEKSEDEGELFLRATAGATPIHAAEEDRPEKTRPNPSRPPERAEQNLFLEAMQKIGTTFRRPEPEPGTGDEQRQSASSRMKQLRRGTIRVSGELDLHGLIRDEAVAKLEHFISAAYVRGQKAVLVITGKGNNSPEGPVLQGAAADWLRGKGRQMVVEFAPAPRDKGGSGAFVVFLKSR